jgi:hypothetical protein
MIDQSLAGRKNLTQSRSGQIKLQDFADVQESLVAGLARC